MYWINSYFNFMGVLFLFCFLIFLTKYLQCNWLWALTHYDIKIMWGLMSSDVGTIMLLIAFI